MHKRMIAGLSLLLAPVIGACFTADFDGDADGVFSCQVDADCKETQVCSILHRCLNNTGPSLQIKGPEPLREILIDDADLIQISITGDSLSLVEGQDYIEVMLDGQPLVTIIEGDLDAGLIFLADLSGSTAGIHRLTAKAFRADGTEYTNPSALARSLFWLDDGLPHVGIVKPFAGELLRAGEDLEAEVAAINFDFVNPAFDDEPGVGQHGHVHLYLDKDDFPECLPGCYQSYAENGALSPEGDKVERLVTGTIGGVPETGGDVKISVSLNYGTHYPYPADTDIKEVWDTGVYDGLLVLDTIAITLVE